MTRGVDGFVLMRTDEYGSEYLPGYAERVAWLTGFTGSAAQAAVLADRATVLSDGRYTVQLAQQVDEALFERRHLVDQPLAQWLEEHLPEGARLGYDPWLAKRAEREKLEKVVAKRHGTLVALDPNPIDRIWPDRPPPPIAPVRRQDVAYAGESDAAKRERIAGEVASKGADALALTAANSIAWLLNLRGGDIAYNPLVLSFVLLSRDGTCRWFVDRRKLPAGLDLPNAVAVEPVERFHEALDRTRACRQSGDDRSGLHACRLSRPAGHGRRQTGRGRRPLRARQGTEEHGRARRRH